MNNKLNTSAKALISCDLINDVVKLFGDTFLVAYFLQVSNENIVQVSLYYIIVYALLGLGHILLGKTLKKHTKGRINIYRIGIIVKSIFVLLIVLLKNNINSYYIRNNNRINFIYKYCNICICFNCITNSCILFD